MGCRSDLLNSVSAKDDSAVIAETVRTVRLEYEALIHQA